MATEITGYWTFFCNPARWEIDRFLATNPPCDTYEVTAWQQHHFKPGQLGVIRVGVDRRTKRQLGDRSRLQPGVYALVEIMTEPREREQPPDPFWLDWTEQEAEKPIVDIRFLGNFLHNPLYLDELRLLPEINDPYLIYGFQAASMPLNEQSFKAILSLTNGDPLLENVQTSPISDITSVIELEHHYAHAVPKVKEVISKRIERGPLGSKVKALTNYRCMICEALGQNPYSFRTRDGEFYIETHHVVFVSEGKPNTLGLSNLITVCANHHRQLHYGDAELIGNLDDRFVFQIDGQNVQINKIAIATE
jgi:hypothetical protein